MTRPAIDSTITPDELANVQWHISTRSTSGGSQCVEAGPLNDGTGRVAVRHSKHQHPDGPVIVYTRAEWNAFLSGTKDNEFDFTQ